MSARFDNLDPDRQEAILAAAGEEFAANGYTGASLSRIIRAAEISKGSLYYYFDDKADLFATTIREAVQRLLADSGGFDLERLDRSNYWDSVRAFGLQSTRLMSKDEWYVRLALAFPRLRDEPEAVEGVREALEWSRRLTTEVLRRGRDLQVVRRDLPLGLLVEVTMATDEAGDRWMIERLDEYPGDALVKLVEARIDMMRDMLDAENEGWES